MVKSDSDDSCVWRSIVFLMILAAERESGRLVFLICRVSGGISIESMCHAYQERAYVGREEAAA